MSILGVDRTFTSESAWKSLTRAPTLRVVPSGRKPFTPAATRPLTLRGLTAKLVMPEPGGASKVPPATIVSPAVTFSVLLHSNPISRDLSMPISTIAAST